MSTRGACTDPQRSRMEASDSILVTLQLTSFQGLAPNVRDTHDRPAWKVGDSSHERLEVVKFEC